MTNSKTSPNGAFLALYVFGAFVGTFGTHFLNGMWGDSQLIKLLGLDVFIWIQPFIQTISVALGAIAVITLVHAIGRGEDRIHITEKDDFDQPNANGDVRVASARAAFFSVLTGAALRYWTFDLMHNTMGLRKARIGFPLDVAPTILFVIIAFFLIIRPLPDNYGRLVRLGLKPSLARLLMSLGLAASFLALAFSFGSATSLN